MSALHSCRKLKQYDGYLMLEILFALVVRDWKIILRSEMRSQV
ncbi:hypothetical protein PSE_3553 [Pseudovibrio sp. FO-BEG1]|nr:hypothetical protein PSE_3553 [Pseudovibrio sp. FO-BEG1]